MTVRPPGRDHAGSAFDHRDQGLYVMDVEVRFKYWVEQAVGQQAIGISKVTGTKVRFGRLLPSTVRQRNPSATSAASAMEVLLYTSHHPMDQQRRRILRGAWVERAHTVVKYMRSSRPTRTFGAVEATVPEASACRAGAMAYLTPQQPGVNPRMEIWKT
ncbi:hypothetical protein GJV26_00340 [Massilia dura]|uniref:Uncharacterized protein n=1 Tax=Pseudoduganella dura TaxID=321982 RepID=A0A6I3X576_9BURK|nr:hypothetical protein [Pseudoduganella dura]MUI10946.1 hypothetical protein [Pseudoduganella dura]GGY02919.1 hypothetical protein GCM10007386_37330 [Pseudoduganella dura]